MLSRGISLTASTLVILQHDLGLGKKHALLLGTLAISC